MNNNPRNAPERYGSFAAYGFSRDIELPRRDGSRIRYTFLKPDGSTFGFDNFWLSPKTYEQVFAEAGFEDFHFVDCRAELPPGQDRTFWDDFLRDCPITGLEARRPG